MKRNILTTLAALALLSCAQPDEDWFTSHELALIHDADSTMRVLTIEDSIDLAVLRASSRVLSPEMLQSDEFRQLSRLMVSTVTHPSQDGVGIAGPQVGLNRRVVAVQRFDKEPVLRKGCLEHPFEVYPNISIVWASDSMATGSEGCLSVPDRRGDVPRSQEIVIEYALISQADSSRNCRSDDRITMVRDTVSGFTAVIFQHEIDHLDGILYTDRIKP